MNKLVTAVAAMVFASGLAAVPSSAQASTTAYDGICTGADALTGTTLVVDFQALNGNGGTAAPTLTRCSPNPTGVSRTGVKAMQDAGITPTGAQRWGLAFICRINGRPSATEQLPIAGNPTYKEACINTPPAAAYWSYWHADGKGTTWTYSNLGAANRTVTPGGFEGWSFSLNATATTNPAPRVTPKNPAVSQSSPTVTLANKDLGTITGTGSSSARATATLVVK